MTAFDAQSYFESGEDFGKAGALILFGRSVRTVDTLSTNSYNSYSVLSGFASALGACDGMKQKMYSVASTFGDDFWAGFTKIFEHQSKPVSAADQAFFLH